MQQHNNDSNTLAHTKWNCKYHIAFAPKYRGNLKFAYRNREFWCRGYYVDTTGKNTAAIKAYIQNQLKVDKETDQLSLFDPQDPFTGGK